MNNEKKLKFKMILMIFFLMVGLFILQEKSSKVIGMPIKQNLKNEEEEYTTTVRTNMLDANSSVVTQATMINLVGTKNKITAIFAYLPRTTEKIMAVLADENVGGVVQKKFLNEDNTVVFDNIPDSLKIPAIHLYKQSSTDSDFVLRKENFIASTSYLMPDIKKNLIRYIDVPPENSRGTIISTSTAVVIYKSREEGLWSAALPVTFFHDIAAPQGIIPKEVFAVVIPLDANGNPIKKEEPHKQWVSTDYKELANPLPFLCRFDFSVPEGTKTVYIHFYRNSLDARNFVCKTQFNTAY